MVPWRRVRFLLAIPLVGLLFPGVSKALDTHASPRMATTLEVPNAYGTDSYTVTTVSATAFYPDVNNWHWETSGSLGRTGPTNFLTEFYASLDIPAGVIIDYIGLNSLTDTDFAFGVQVFQRTSSGSLLSVATFSSTPHGWGTDFNASPIDFLWTGQSGKALIINVEQAVNSNPQFFGWVEIWWRRVVSPAPGSPTFNDVPIDHAFFQYIEALADSGITGGCGNGNYCPDNPLTRGQMAVFLAKALGLHWPGN